MSSTYSSLKIELIGTGEQLGTWGQTTDTNLGTAIEEAIVGRATVDFATDADKTITLINSNATQAARNFVLNLTSSTSLTATRTLFVPAISKPYLIQNNTTGGQSIVVSNATGTGVTVPNGTNAFVYNDGTNVVDAITSYPSNVVTLAGAQTLTNKNIEKRVVVIADAASITINADTTDIATQANTQALGTLTINAPTGTPFNGQQIVLRLRSTNVQTFSWNAIFQGSDDMTLPTVSSGAGKYDYMGFQYNSTAAKWQMLAKNFGF